MRALWIATSLCLASTAVLAQSASRTVVGLDTCFKLVRVAEANCSTSANDAAQRPACLQNARKVQLECLELAGPQASASVDRPPTAAGAVSSDKPAEAVSPVIAAGTSPAGNPVAGASADQKESQSAKTLAAAPSDKSVAATSPGAATHIDLGAIRHARVGLDGERNHLARGLLPSRHGDDPRAARDEGCANGAGGSLSRTPHRTRAAHGRVLARVARRRNPGRLPDQRSADGQAALDCIRGWEDGELQGGRGRAVAVVFRRRATEDHGARWIGSGQARRRSNSPDGTRSATRSRRPACGRRRRASHRERR